MAAGTCMAAVGTRMAVVVDGTPQMTVPGMPSVLMAVDGTAPANGSRRATMLMEVHGTAVAGTAMPTALATPLLLAIKEVDRVAGTGWDCPADGSGGPAAAGNVQC